MPGTHVRLTIVGWLAALLACGCGEQTPAPAPAPATQASGGGDAAPVAPAPAPALAADAISVSAPAEFGRYPELSAAVRSAAADARARFEAEAGAAAARGEDVDGWSLHIDWRLLRGNRYLWLAEGEGEAVRGATATPVHLRLAWDGIGRRVLAFGDWFTPEGWSQVVELLRAQRLAPPGVADDPDSWRTLPYEPVYAPEGAVIRFDLLVPGQGGDPRRVPVPRDAVDAWIADDRRVLLDAAAAGP